MSISIQSVYNTVLYALNKEQRGYVGPDEFNKFALLSQQKIFERYFSDLASYSISQKGMIRDTGYSDLAKNLRMKIDIFAEEEQLSLNGDVFDLPSDNYRLDTVVHKPDSSTFRVIPELTKMEGYRVMQAPLTKPTETFPKFQRYGNQIEVYPSSIVDDVYAQYIKMPDDPYWGYTDLGTSISGSTDGKLFFDADESVDFMLHSSEEYRLVAEILVYAGLSTKEQDVVQFATQASLQDMEITKS